MDGAVCSCLRVIFRPFLLSFALRTVYKGRHKEEGREGKEGSIFLFFFSRSCGINALRKYRVKRIKNVFSPRYFFVPSNLSNGHGRSSKRTITLPATISLSRTVIPLGWLIDIVTITARLAGNPVDLFIEDYSKPFMNYSSGGFETDHLTRYVQLSFSIHRLISTSPFKISLYPLC